MPDPLPGLDTLVKGRTDIAKALATAVAEAVARQDTDHDAFCGCIDWHSAVHGTWALVAYARMTGDSQHDALVAQVLRADKLAAERNLLGANPDFEMPYGRAWFLRLAREHARYSGNDTLKAMADDVLASLLAACGKRRPNPRRGSYGSDSWALINMHDYCSWSGNAAALAAVRGWVEAHFLDHEGGCDYATETGHFMGVCTNWAWLVSKVLPQDAFDRWAEAFFGRGGLPHPVTQPVNWHHHGLNFSRAWGLCALSAATGSATAKRAYRDAYVAHFRATYDQPEHWRGSYQGVGHWVPQFGMLALQPLFDL